MPSQPPPPPAAWHLVAGTTGAGKTTLARQLATHHRGLVFALDDWMQTLFWPDCPARNDLAFALERIARCETQIAATATRLAHLGVPSILDLGLTQRQHRNQWLARARAARIPITLTVADADPNLRWARVLQRNQSAAPALTPDPSGREPASTFSFEVTRPMFDFMEARWEPVLTPELQTFDPHPLPSS